MLCPPEKYLMQTVGFRLVQTALFSDWHRFVYMYYLILSWQRCCLSRLSSVLAAGMFSWAAQQVAVKHWSIAESPSERNRVAL